LVCGGDFGCELVDGVWFEGSFGGFVGDDASAEFDEEHMLIGIWNAVKKGLDGCFFSCRESVLIDLACGVDVFVLVLLVDEP